MFEIIELVRRKEQKNYMQESGYSNLLNKWMWNKFCSEYQSSIEWMMG